MVSAVPSSIHRVASATVSGDAITVADRNADANVTGRTGVRHNHIGSTQPRSNTFGESRDMPRQVRRDRRKWRMTMTMFWNEAIGIVLNDRDMKSACDRSDLPSPLIGNGQRCRILQRRIEIDRLRLELLQASANACGSMPSWSRGKPTRLTPSCAAIDLMPG